MFLCFSPSPSHPRPVSTSTRRAVATTTLRKRQNLLLGATKRNKLSKPTSKVQAELPTSRPNPYAGQVSQINQIWGNDKRSQQELLDSISPLSVRNKYVLNSLVKIARRIPTKNENGFPILVVKALLKALEIKKKDVKAYDLSSKLSSLGWPQAPVVNLALELIQNPKELKKLQEEIGTVASGSRLQFNQSLKTFNFSSDRKY